MSVEAFEKNVRMLACETNVKKYEMSDELQEDNKSGSTKGWQPHLSR